VDLIHEIRKHAEPLLLGITDQVQKESEWRTSGASASGFFRLLPYGVFAPALEAPGGGTRYSFEKRKHTDLGHQLEGTPEWLSAEFILDLAKLDSAEYQGVLAGRCPARLEGNARERWNFLWTTRSTYTRDDGTSERGISGEAKQHWTELRSETTLTKQDHSYLVRAIDPDADTDRLVLLTVLETSDNGTTLCWRELKRFDR